MRTDTNPRLSLALRVLISPFALFWLFGAAAGFVLVWVFDPTYDHNAATRAFGLDLFRPMPPIPNPKSKLQNR